MSCNNLAQICTGRTTICHLHHGPNGPVNLGFWLYSISQYALSSFCVFMKRKGAYDGQLLSLEGSYELAARPEMVRASDSPECVWNHEICRAVVTRERGKQLATVGIRIRNFSNTVGVASQEKTRIHSEDTTESSARRPEDIPQVTDISDPKRKATLTGSPSSATSKSTSADASSPAPLILYPEEALLLVEQGARILR